MHYLHAEEMRRALRQKEDMVIKDMRVAVAEENYWNNLRPMRVEPPREVGFV